MNILAALAQSQANKQAQQDNGRVICADGLLSVHDAVWECSLYRLGHDHKEWRDEPVQNRGKLLQQLEAGQ